MQADVNQSVHIVEGELLKYGTYAANTTGVSMRPLFKTHRDVAVLKKTDRTLKKYDIVLYTGASHKYILHRIIGVREECFIIRGDNTFVKEYVSRDRVLAYLVSFNRKGKHHTVDEFGYKFYSRFWNLIYPVRYLAHLMRRALGKIKRTVFRRGSKNDR